MNSSSFSEELLIALQSTDWITWLATITAVAYILLAIRENPLCWHFGNVSSGLSAYVYFSQTLWYEGLLNIIYVILGAYGWYKWKFHKKQDHKKISSLSVGKTVTYLLLAAVISVPFGILSKTFTHSDLPYADAAITTFSLVATYMTAEKILQNWILWIVIDLFAAVIYYIKGPEMYLFSLLFLFYGVISVRGYLKWKTTLK